MSEVKLFSIKSWRAIWLQLHLYLGLSAGIIFVIAGLTGSLLVFYIEIDEWLNPALHLEKSITFESKISYEAILTSLHQAHPQRTGAWRMELPRDSQSMMMARYYKPEETHHLHFAPLIVWINPYTAKVISSRFWGQYLMTWLYDLHYQLWLDLSGKTIMAIIGGLLLIVTITGIYLWWPRHWRQLKATLTFKKNSHPARFIFDLHKINGIYSFILIILLLITGILLELPDTFNPMINHFSPLTKLPEPKSIRSTDSQRISVDKAVNLAQHYYPQAQLRWIETPKNNQASYRIIFYQKGEPSKRFPKTMIWIDQYNGQLLAIHDPLRFNSSGDTFINWLHPLHNGEIAGLIGRCFIFISGFVPLILWITGFIRWRQKAAVNFKKSKSSVNRIAR
ncbi:MAG: hypothetical protein RL637_253 [Pseudomonadota bacterium]|jgi:uncharacterized iron-regulated membrane protein